jgi:S-adenosylmethionine-diacylglycerol 3-amino-3-carboxypropyl transferase
VSSFFDQIVYSSANEDPLSEIRGLNLCSSDRLLCITGSGARVLDLLGQADCPITAVDFNSKQNYLLELKMAAINHLDYDAMLDFLGVTPCVHRPDLFASIKTDLSIEAALFWQKHPELIKAGVLYQGTWEHYMHFLSRCFFIKKNTLMKLFSCQSLEEQKAVWNKEWDSISWSVMMYLLGRRSLWKYFLKEPGIVFVPKGFDISGYMKMRFKHIAYTQLFHSNPYLNLIFHGEYREVLPLHLQEPSFYLLKNRLTQISIKQGSLQQILNKSAHQYTAFSLSDFSSYSDKANYESTWQSIVQAASPQAKFVERNFLVKYPVPEQVAQQIEVDQNLSQKLTDEDHSFIYDIRCGTIRSNLR